MPLGQEARIPATDRPSETRIVDSPCESGFVDTRGEGRP